MVARGRVKVGRWVRDFMWRQLRRVNHPSCDLARQGVVGSEGVQKGRSVGHPRASYVNDCVRGEEGEEGEEVLPPPPPPEVTAGKATLTGGAPVE